MTRTLVALFLCSTLGACSGTPEPAPSSEVDETAPDPPVPNEHELPRDSPHEHRGSERAPNPDCRELANGLDGDPVRSRRLRRYSSTEHVVDGLWRDVSVRRERGRLRVHWWMEERGCPPATEIVRTDDLIILREAPDPRSRCLAVGATLMETIIEAHPSDRRLCVPGRDYPIRLDDLARFEAPVARPSRRTSEPVDPWAVE